MIVKSTKQAKFDFFTFDETRRMTFDLMMPQKKMEIHTQFFLNKVLMSQAEKIDKNFRLFSVVASSFHVTQARDGESAA